MDDYVLILQVIVFVASLLSLVVATVKQDIVKPILSLSWSAFSIEVLFVILREDDNVQTYLSIWDGAIPTVSLLIGLVIGSVIGMLVGLMTCCLPSHGKLVFFVQHVLIALTSGFSLSYSSFWLDGSVYSWSLLSFYGFWLLWIGIVFVYVGVMTWMYRRGNVYHFIE